MRKTAKEKFLLSIAVIPTVCVVILIYIGVPTIKSMYSEYKEVLPTQTEAVFSFYQFVAILPLFVIAAWFSMRKYIHRSIVTILLGVVGSVVVAAAVVWAVYQPDIVITLIENSYKTP